MSPTPWPAVSAQTAPPTLAARAEWTGAAVTAPMSVADGAKKAAETGGARRPGTGPLSGGAGSAGNAGRAGVAGVPVSQQTGPIPGVTPWARCFTEGLRPAQQPADPLPSRSWRVFAAARSPRLADLGSRFTADPNAGRTLAVVEDPADERSRTTALAAAKDAVSTGELVVVTTDTGFTGFFATLHAEHPSIGITVLRVSSDAANPATIAPFATAAPGQF